MPIPRSGVTVNAVEILTRVRESAAKRILFLPHAIRQMVRPDRMITTDEVCDTILRRELVEDYPNDARGHSCLLLGIGTQARPIHVVCAPKDEYLAVITAYVPSLLEWMPDFKTRKRP